ncbi:hypothetical protein VZ94_06840 [Methylocucumis oryzae]|uniref:Uncharacterized protein n=2 Tax=Methylocucumis oryzae TaxID=1632867 RepID=A0A0F3IKD7_9GAMM|nr:hypothetical protein VZ94_06840 [Methylocucumis oryzae]
MLKPLSHAQRDGDAIYAVIKATTINHDGRTHGFTVPNPNAQAELVAEALTQAKIDARAVSYIEAHGTGTALGDPVEVTGLMKAFQAMGKQPEQCALGSVKSNIGHCEAAAGMAGLSKILLQLKHGQLAPTLHSAEVNPNINFTATPFYLPQQLTPWVRPVLDGIEQPRVACLSSFGAGGANAHAVLTEYLDAVAKPETTPASEPVCIVLSAEQPERLRLVVQRLWQTIKEPTWQSQPKHSLLNLAYTLQTGREALTYRLGFVSASLPELAVQLSDYLASCGTQSVPYEPITQESEHGRVRFAYQNSVTQSEFETNKVGMGYQHQLLATWLAGNDVDWQALYHNQPVQRLNLPGYPFEQQRYGWAHTITESVNRPAPSVIAAVATVETKLTTSLHPEQRVQSELKHLVHTVLKLPLDRININSNFIDFGFDSITLAELARAIAKHYAISFSPAVFFSQTNINALTRYLLNDCSELLIEAPPEVLQKNCC